MKRPHRLHIGSETGWQYYRTGKAVCNELVGSPGNDLQRRRGDRLNYLFAVIEIPYPILAVDRLTYP